MTWGEGDWRRLRPGPGSSRPTHRWSRCGRPCGRASTTSSRSVAPGPRIPEAFPPPTRHPHRSLILHTLTAPRSAKIPHRPQRTLTPLTHRTLTPPRTPPTPYTPTAPPPTPHTPTPTHRPTHRLLPVLPFPSGVLLAAVNSTNTKGEPNF